MADARLYLFIGIFVLVYFLESIGGSYLVSAVQAIERQFQIPSKVSGFLVSASDMGYIPSVIFVSYYGGLSNRAKWIGFGTILIALAHISIAMPNFIFPVQQPKLNLTKIEIQLMPSNLLISTEASIIDFMTYIPIMERIPDDLKHLIEEKIRTHKNIDKSRLLKYSKDHDQIHNQSISENDNVGEENQGGETTYSVDSDLITDIFTSFPKWLDGKITDKTMLNKLQKYANNRKQNMKQDIKTLRKAAIAPFAFCGKLVLGLGRSTPWCLGIPLIDDTIKKKSLMPIYFAGVSFIRILGPICGFVLGSMMNKIYYTSFVPTGLTPKDPTWIGRWWLGFLLIGIVTLIPSLALFFFPNPTAKSVDKTKELEDDMKKKEKKGLVLSDKPTVKDTEENQITKTLSEKAKEFVVSYKPVIQSKVYLGVVLGRTCDILAFKGWNIYK
uniref:Solute carrier organic anion transporter family member n=1 Tax=Rhabditophanes sp. KR3021 TaxID=114890 RepID=A0AC35THQ7_9BILA